MAGFQKNALRVRLVRWLSGRVARLQALTGRITPPPFRLLQIGSAFWQSRALHAAARLDIATRLGDEALDAARIAARVSAQPDATYRLLRMLAALGVFEETRAGLFRNNALSDYLRADRANNLRDLVLMHNSPQMSRPWYENLEQGIRTGEPPFRLAHGAELFAYMDDHADFDALFSRAMDSVEALTGDSFASDFDWGRFERVLDIGGAKGGKSVAILKRHAGLKALVVDRPSVIEQARAHWQERLDAALLARLDFQAGDVLAALPAARSERDIYLLSAVLHGFDDRHCIDILGRLAEACGDTGAHVAVLELVMPARHADYASTSFDMQMFMGTSGRERTGDEWREIIAASRLRLVESVALRPFGNILVLQAADRLER